MKPVDSGGHATYQKPATSQLKKYFPNNSPIPRRHQIIAEQFYGLDLPPGASQMNSVQKRTIFLHLRYMHQAVPHKVNFTLQRCQNTPRKALLYSGNKLFVRLSDDQFQTLQATALQTIENAFIGFQRFFLHRINSQNIVLLVFIDTTY